MKHFYSILFCLVLSLTCFSQFNRFGLGTTLSATQQFGKSRISFAMAYQQNIFFKNPYANSYSMYMQLTAPCKFLKYSAFTLGLAIQVMGGYTNMNYQPNKYFADYNMFPYYTSPFGFYSPSGIGF